MKDESLLDFTMIWIKAVATPFTMYAVPVGLFVVAFTLLIDRYFVGTTFEIKRYIGAFLFVMLIGYVVSLWHVARRHTHSPK